ncbi:MAG: glycosyltransferase family 2 protein [Candidatus Levybacteria bacterium]|nr:glycosyltransferase family 2 protein [Candidatus Levybacteria bacterium]
MTKNKPLVSIILPIHNSGEFLSDCLSSLLRQTHKNIEIIAIDDNSYDSSYKILRTFARKDKRIRGLRNIKRYGPSITLNRLLRRTKGSFVAFMDAEDVSLKDRIKKQVNFLEKNIDVVAVGTQCVFIEGRNKRIGKSNFPRHNQDIYQSPLHGVSMQFETIMINRNLLPKDVLKFNTKSKTFIYSDVFLKVLPYGKVVNLDDYLHYHRNHPGTYFSDLRKNPVSFIKLFLKSKAFYSYSSPFRSFFAPFIRTL